MTMEKFGQHFYSSYAWEQTRKAYAKKARGLCEVCAAKGLIVPGEIVHHKIHLTPENINDPRITLSFDNLQYVCRQCHAEIHSKEKRRYVVDKNGHVSAR